MKFKNNINIFLVFILFIGFIAYPLLVTNSYATYTNGDYTNICSSATPNVKSSLILSIISMCLPGVLQKVEEYKQIQCQEVVCYYNSVKNGLDPAYCSQIQAYQTCKYVVGEVFSVTGLDIIDNLKQKIAYVLANPVGIMYSVAVKYAENSIGGPLKSSTSMGVPSIFLAVNNIASAIETFKELKQNGFLPQTSSINYCKELPAIKKEMQSIIKAQ